MSLAPIALFTYNRLWHSQQTIESLQQNSLAKDSELYIFSDGAKTKEGQAKVDELRTYLHTVKGFKKVSIQTQDQNLGLANSIINGVTQIIKEFGKIIVLEDDMVSSPHFLSYMNEGLNLYQNEEKLACIHGYRYPIGELERPFFVKGADCWGWGTWSRAWKNFNPNGKELLEEIKTKQLSSAFNFSDHYPYVQMLEDQIAGKNDSWAIRWKASAFLKEQFTLYYHESLIENIGNDNSGTHSEKTDHYRTELAQNYIPLSLQTVEEQNEVIQRIEKFYAGTKPRLLQRIKNKFLSKKP